MNTPLHWLSSSATFPAMLLFLSLGWINVSLSLPSPNGNHKLSELTAIKPFSCSHVHKLRVFCFLLMCGNVVVASLKVAVSERCNKYVHQHRLGGLPRCKNLTRFSLFASFCFAVRYCFKCFCFLCFTSSVSFTGSYTEVKPAWALGGIWPFAVKS